MDIHGEDTFGLRDNGLLFRHSAHHMYFNDFSMPSAKALKELEEIDALSRHHYMKALDDEPSSLSMDPRSPSRHISSSSLDFEPSLKLEDDDELGSTFAFFRKPSIHPSSHFSHNVDDLLTQHHNNRHDFGFTQSFDSRAHNSVKGNNIGPNGVNGFFNINHHDLGSRNTDSAMVPTIQPAATTIINNISNINHINNINNIHTVNNINNNIFNSYNTVNNINNNINISININSTPPPTVDMSKHNIDMSEVIDDKSAIHLINNNSLEFLDEYITTGSNSSSSPDDSPLSGDDEDVDVRLNDSSASLANAFNNAAMTPLVTPMPTMSNPLHRINSAAAPTYPSSHGPISRLHHSTGSILTATSTPVVHNQLASTCTDTSGYHSLTASCNIVMADSSANAGDAEAIPIVLAPGGTTVIDGITYNNRGYEVCGSLNKFNKPCQRIGRCPFHHDSSSPKKSPTTSSADPTSLTNVLNNVIHNGTPANPNLSNPSPTTTERRYLPIKKGPYKSGWKKDEHIRFLRGLMMHGKGSWKEIALVVGTRTPTQIQVHAHRYYLRQQQETKNKRSIHDISLNDLEMMEGHGTISTPLPGTPPHISPSSPDRSNHTDLSLIFNSPHPPLQHSQSTPTTPTHHHHHHHHHHSSAHASSVHQHISTPLAHPLSHSDGIPNSTYNMSGPSSAMSSPPISAPSSPIIPPISPPNFPSLFSGSATTSSLSNTGLSFPTFSMAPSYSSSPMTFHSPNSWYSSSSSSPSSSAYNSMSNLNSMTINMSGDVDLHMSLPASDHHHKLLSASFSHIGDEYDDPHAHHAAMLAEASSQSHPSSPEFPSDDE